MNIKLIMSALLGISLFSFVMSAEMPVQQTYELQDLHRQEFTVTKVSDWEDADAGAFFTFDDGSKWVRTWWDGPVYFLDIGQKVVVIPMDEEEVEKHTWGLMYNVRPYWLVVNQRDPEGANIVYNLYVIYKW